FGPSPAQSVHSARFDIAGGGFLGIGNGPHVLEAGTRFEGAGLPVLLNGSFTLAGDVTAERLELADGTLSGPGALTVNGLFAWNGGTLSGSGLTQLNGGLFLGPQSGLGPGRGLDGRTLNNAGAAVLAACCLNLSNGAVLNNLPGASFELRGDVGIGMGPGGPAPAFRNGGAFRKSSGAGFAFIGVPFENSGTVEAQAGTLDIGSRYVQTAGATILAGGGLASMSGAPLEIRGGSLSGSGTISTSVINAGRLQPGSSPGGLHINGAYTQEPAGALSVELGGLTPGTQFDQLTVSRTATLDGALEVKLIGGFVPADGDAIQVLTFGSRSGVFSAISGLDLGGGRSLRADLGERGLTLLAPGTGPSGTATSTPTATHIVTSTPTATPTSTGTPTPMATGTATPSPTPPPSPTWTATATPTVTVTPTPTATPGAALAAGVGLVDGAEGPAVFVFSVRRSQLDGEPTGRLEYRGSRRGAIVRGVALTSFQVVGETASFGGTCVQVTAGGSEAPCIYKATAVDGDR
ncbi:MAG TPA: hypothetical protein VH257_21780, partial [Chloroflexota bacterium]|nr:hypothetical protein [Chloroflexota bacterium]